MTSQPLDRRQSPRFDIVNPLWADIELPETAPVRNASDTGALIETSVCPALNSRHLVTFRSDERSAEVVTVVRHVRPSPRGRTFLVGLEAEEATFAQVFEGRFYAGPANESLPAIDPPPADRRRSARVPCGTSVFADICWPRPVRVADVSAGGALLLSRQRGSIGARGLVRLTVGAHRFAAAVEVRRQAAFYDQSGFYLGVRFLGMIDHQRGLVDTLMAETV
ncbi:MAG: PilZ domain-containing protein [Vicinamibacterales bacterium]